MYEYTNNAYGEDSLDFDIINLVIKNNFRSFNSWGKIQ